MKKSVRFVALFLAIMMVLSIFASAFAVAEEPDWTKPILAYGSGLDSIALDKTLSSMGIDNRDSIDMIRVDSKDLKKYLDRNDSDQAMISSVLLNKEKKGNGVDVIIKTPDNISQVTAVQYANAAITAGVTDATIKVASYRKATGKAALTGVYKVFEATGEDLEEDRIHVANEELETVNAIVQEHKDEDGFTAENFNKVIVEIKQSLIDLKEKTGNLATKEEIQSMINEALESNNLDGVVNQINIDKLVVFFNNFQNSSAIDSNKIKEQLDELGKNLKDKFDEFLDNAEKSGLLDKVKVFFVDLGKAISNFIKSIGK